MIRRTSFVATLLALGLFACSTAFAVPNVLQYQGRLTDSAGNPLSGSQTIVFKLYSVATGGTASWTETQTVTAANGLFNVALGSVTAFPAGLFSGADLYLGITVGTDAEMTPRQRITSVAYAQRAGVADNAAGLSNKSGTAFKNLTTAGVAADSITITTPAAGYIVVSAGGYSYVSHLNGTEDEWWINVSETRGSAPLNSSVQVQRAVGTIPSDTYIFNFHNEAVFSKAAGTYKFYLNGQTVSSGATGQMGYYGMQAIYVPMLYGTLSIPQEENFPEGFGAQATSRSSTP